jgi:hypothetical protein
MIRKIRNVVISANAVTLSTLSVGDSVTLKGPQGGKSLSNKDVFVIKGPGAKPGTLRLQRMEEGASGKNVDEGTPVHTVVSIEFEQEVAPVAEDTAPRGSFYEAQTSTTNAVPAENAALAEENGRLGDIVTADTAASFNLG